jgi:dTDP-4-amino-4,6-dideoxygalactose transaminase
MGVYRVPFVDLPTHYARLEPELLPVIQDTLRRGDVILREQLRAFEKNLAAFVGTTCAVGVNSGFDAIHLSVRAAGIGPGDEVITVAHTFVATVAAIVHVGATPVLVDVGEDFNMDLEAFEGAITPRTRALIPVHLNGRLCDMERLMRVAQAHGLAVIEDAAQALGATLNGQKAGSFGLTGCFSLYPFKMLGAFGDGGIVTTNDLEIAQKISWLRDHGQDRVAREYRCFGFNCRLDNLQAALLDVKLRHLPAWIERRRAIARMYHDGLSRIPQLRLPHFSDSRFYDVYQNYVIRAEQRDELAAHLEDSGVETLISWRRPLHHHEALGLSHLRLPETERIGREVLSLPMNTELTDEQVACVIESVWSFYKRGI